MYRGTGNHVLSSSIRLPEREYQAIYLRNGMSRHEEKHGVPPGAPKPHCDLRSVQSPGVSPDRRIGSRKTLQRSVHERCSHVGRSLGGRRTHWPWRRDRSTASAELAREAPPEGAMINQSATAPGDQRVAKTAARIIVVSVRRGVTAVDNAHRRMPLYERAGTRRTAVFTAEMPAAMSGHRATRSAWLQCQQTATVEQARRQGVRSLPKTAASSCTKIGPRAMLQERDGAIVHFLD